MIECDIVIIQFPCQTMDLGTLSLQEYLFFPTNHVRHPLSDPGDPDIITAIVMYIQALKCM